MNLGNALEAPNEGDWGVTLQAEYFKLIHDAKFQSVRVPIRWSAHASTDRPYTISRQFFNRVDWAIREALQNELLVIINMHHYEELFSDPENHRERFISLWEQIAAHYKDYPADVIFELCNEPHDKLTATLWNAYLVEALQVVRKTNPTRNIIIGPANWNNLNALDKLQLPADDPHIIVTFHYYSPFQFTHQGAGWVDGSDAWLGTKWTGTTSEKQAVTNDFDRVVAWATAHNRPVFMGEFGAFSTADMPSRARWTLYVARQAESHEFSWAYWEFCSGFGVYNKDTGEWRTPLLNALIPSVRE